MSWQVVFDGSDSVYCEESVEEMEPLSSKPPSTKRKKTCNVDEFHWETGQRTSEDTTTQNKEKGCYNASPDIKIRRDVLKCVSTFDSWHRGC